MKKILVMGLIALMAAVLSAQTGLFDLSFGDSMDDAIEILESNGFSVDETGENYMVMVDEENYYVNYLRMNFADGLLVGWSIEYNDPDDEDIEDLVMDALVSRHGEDYYWEDDWEYYYWNLGDGAYVEAGWDWDYYYFWVEYYKD